MTVEFHFRPDRSSPRNSTIIPQKSRGTKSEGERFPLLHQRSSFTPVPRAVLEPEFARHGMQYPTIYPQKCRSTFLTEFEGKGSEMGLFSIVTTDVEKKWLLCQRASALGTAHFVKNTSALPPGRHKRGRRGADSSPSPKAGFLCLNALWIPCRPRAALVPTPCPRCVDWERLRRFRNNSGLDVQLVTQS